MTTPLPRSLAPLRHESLPGFLLRLAHRLDVSPLQVAIRAGLSSDRDHKTIPASVLVTLPADTASAFAHATRLSVAEVTDLTLASLAARYPFLDTSLVRHRRQRRVGPPLRDPWVFTRFTRYCPDCLRGDGSLIQRRHGGAWSKYWRLPVVFACPTHQRLLEHACPACGVLALTRPANQARPLPMAGQPVSHPAACRNPDPAQPTAPCGYRLDRPTGSGEGIGRMHPEQHLLRLQQRLLCLLDGSDRPAPEVLGQPTTASRYFVDLRIVAGLLHAGWPVGRDLVDPADAMTFHRHITTDHKRSTGGGRHPVQPHDTPPPDAATAAAVLACADRLLAADPDTVRGLARAAFGALPTSSDWVKSFLPGDGHCSAVLADVVGVEARAGHVIRKLGIPHRGIQPPPQPVAFQPRHIPQYLPDLWYDAHFADLVGINPRWLRRAVPILLIRICAGGAVRTAGPHIGLPRNAGRHAIDIITAWTHDAPRHRRAFDAAIAALTGQLNTATDLIDYGTRREALQAWQLTAEDWQHLIADLVDAPVNERHVAHTDWSNTKRLLASVWIWTRVTNGECDYAPILFPQTPGRRPGGELSVYVHRRWPAIATAAGHYRDLRPRLDLYADHLIEQIDADTHRQVIPALTHSR